MATATRELAEAKAALAGVTIKAPVDGTVLSVAAPAGGNAYAGAAFITLGDLAELQVKALFTETDIARVQVGRPAAITLATRPGETYSGTVTGIDVTPTVTDRLVRYGVLIAFAEPPGDLLIGQTATVSVTVAEAAGTVHVPARAVRTRADGVATVTVRSGGADVVRTVETGIRDDRYVEIRSGLREGDQVVIRSGGADGFPDGSFPGLN